MDAARLEGVPLFAGLSKGQRSRVAQHADEVSVPAGKELVHEGGLAWDFFVIESGAAAVRHGADTVTTLGPGDFFGEMAVMTAPSARRNASVLSTEPMTAIVMSAHDLRMIAHEIPQVGERLRSAMEQRSSTPS
jgi:CRP-like cAMP-binding protein